MKWIAITLPTGPTGVSVAASRVHGASWRITASQTASARTMNPMPWASPKMKVASMQSRRQPDDEQADEQGQLDVRGALDPRKKRRRCRFAQHGNRRWLGRWLHRLIVSAAPRSRRRRRRAPSPVPADDRCQTVSVRRLLISLLTATAATLTVADPADAAYSLQTVGTFSSPIFVTSEPGDPERLLVVEQGGTIKLVDHGAISTFSIDPARIAERGWRAGPVLGRARSRLREQRPALRLLHARRAAWRADYPGRPPDRRVHRVGELGAVRAHGGRF